MIKKRLLAVIVFSVLCMNPIQAFADSKNNKSEPQVPADSIYSVSSTVNRMVENSPIVRAQRAALRNEQTNYDNVVDASIEIPYKLLKKDRDYYIQVKDLAPLDAEYSLFAASNSLSVIENSAEISAYEKYIKLITLLNNIDYQKKVVEKEKANLDLAENNFKIGRISSVEFDEIKRSYKKAKLQLDGYEISRDIILININNAIGAPILKDYSNLVDLKLLTEKFDLKDIYNMKELDECLEEALTSRSEVIDAEKCLSLKELQYEKVKVAYPNKNDSHNKNAVLGKNDAEAALNVAKINVERNIRESYDDLNEKITSIQNAKMNMNIAKEDYEAAQAKMEKGLVANKEVEESYCKYKQLEVNIKNMEYDLWLYKFKFSYACGIGPGQAVSQ